MGLLSKTEKIEVDVFEICKKVLDNLDEMGWENVVGTSEGHLIFPKKKVKKEDVKRISEQELRQLFIEEFKDSYKKTHNKLYYSIETPTKNKYKFGRTYNDIIKNIGIYKTSALLDMCVFEKDCDEKKYKRILNIEFKHGNAPLKDIAKDVLKLMREKEKGAFIFLLDNTDSGSLNNGSTTRKGVLNKLSESFFKFKGKWEGDKSIQLVIISLDQKMLIHRTVTCEDLKDTKKRIFSNGTDIGYGNITSVNGNDWNNYVIDKKEK